MTTFYAEGVSTARAEADLYRDSYGGGDGNDLNNQPPKEGTTP